MNRPSQGQALPPEVVDAIIARADGLKPALARRFVAGPAERARGRRRMSLSVFGRSAWNAIWRGAMAKEFFHGIAADLDQELLAVLLTGRTDLAGRAFGPLLMRRLIG